MENQDHETLVEAMDEYVVVVEHVETWSKTIKAKSPEEAETIAQDQWGEMVTEEIAHTWSLDNGEFQIVEVNNDE